MACRARQRVMRAEQLETVGQGYVVEYRVIPPVDVMTLEAGCRKTRRTVLQVVIRLVTGRTVVLVGNRISNLKTVCKMAPGTGGCRMRTEECEASRPDGMVERTRVCPRQRVVTRFAGQRIFKLGMHPIIIVVVTCETVGVEWRKCPTFIRLVTTGTTELLV